MGIHRSTLDDHTEIYAEGLGIKKFGTHVPLQGSLAAGMQEKIMQAIKESRAHEPDEPSAGVSKRWSLKRKQVHGQISALHKLSNNVFSGPLCALLLRWQWSLIISTGCKSASNQLVTNALPEGILEQIYSNCLCWVSTAIPQKTTFTQALLSLEAFLSALSLIHRVLSLDAT